MLKNGQWDFVFHIAAHNDEAQCIDTPIGMETGSIPHHAISFSNTKDGYGSQALGRLGIPSSAWCGKQTGSGHMQINLQHIYYICAVATQGGRYPDDYYLVSYSLELSADGIVWDYYQEHSLNKVCVAFSTYLLQILSGREHGGAMLLC